MSPPVSRERALLYNDTPSGLSFCGRSRRNWAAA
jgi:hypothetical protein